MKIKTATRLVAGVIALLLAGRNLGAENKVIRLYEGPAPGSEMWTHTEKESRSERGGLRAYFPAKGGHGFGMRKQNLPTDRWIERFADWLDLQGLLKK
jgi:hypothetical protein